MIAVADDILAEVEADVADLNPEIVRRAFLGHCCQFVANREEFARILRQYTRSRLSIHQLKVDENKFYERHLKRLRTNHYSLLRDHTEKAISYRIELKRIWPCSACVWLYNPTNRLRRFPQLC